MKLLPKPTRIPRHPSSCCGPKAAASPRIRYRHVARSRERLRRGRPEYLGHDASPQFRLRDVALVHDQAGHRLRARARARWWLRTHHDVRSAIAADDAKFGEPEVRFSHLGPLMVMPWIIGLKRAREMLFFGDMIDANTALQFGMVNRVVPAAELTSATLKYAKRLALISPEALRWGKRVINRGAEIAGFRAAIEAGVTRWYRSTRPRPRSARNSDASSRRRT